MSFLIAAGALNIASSLFGAWGARGAAKSQNIINQINYERERDNAKAEKEITNILAHTDDKWNAFTTDLGNQRIMKRGEEEFNALNKNIGRVSKQMTKNQLQGSLIASEQLGQLAGYAAMTGMSEVTRRQLENTAMIQQNASIDDNMESFNDQIGDMQYQSGGIIGNAIRGFNESPILSNNMVAERTVGRPAKIKSPSWFEVGLDVAGGALMMAEGFNELSKANKAKAAQRQKLPETNTYPMKKQYPSPYRGGTFSFWTGRK